jgi:hypothetical protein
MKLEAVILAGVSGDFNHLLHIIIDSTNLPAAVAWSRSQPVIGPEHTGLKPRPQPLILSLNQRLSR